MPICFCAETEASDFARLVGHILQGVEARGPARQLLVHLSGYASSLPLLLLQREEVLQLLLEHLRREDTYGVVLQLLPALAKVTLHTPLQIFPLSVTFSVCA